MSSPSIKLKVKEEGRGREPTVAFICSIFKMSIK